MPRLNGQVGRPARKGVKKPEGGEKSEGVVEYLHSARHGEVNGAVLESGDFVHLGPQGAELVKLGIGQKLSIEGAATTMGKGDPLTQALCAPEDSSGVFVSALF